jgi:hypothetical protein
LVLGRGIDRHLILHATIELLLDLTQGPWAVYPSDGGWVNPTRPFGGHPKVCHLILLCH